MCVFRLGRGVDEGVANITKLAGIKFTYYSRSVSL